jgi:predicted carbohydrate-binding protein with CBM5 and CBM33 domain
VGSARTPAAALPVTLLAAVLFAAAGALVPGTAAAHGAPTTPLSRSAECGAEGTRAGSPACRAALQQSPAISAEWDNVRVADVNGRDREVIPDGQLCSAGKPEFAGLDQPRADWPTTELTAGAELSFAYRGTIPHAGTFRLYATRPGYAPERPLTWATLQAEPFAEVADPPFADGSYRFSATLPAGLTGRHLIYTVWRNSDSTDTYYSCSDVVLVAPAATAVRPAAAADPLPAARPAPGGSATGAPAAAVLAGSAVVAGGVLVAGAVLLVRHRRRSGPDRAPRHRRAE